MRISQVLLHTAGESSVVQGWPELPVPSLWRVTILANTIQIVAYAIIGWYMARGVHRSGQWRTNPLAVAMIYIFWTCTIGHGIHIAHTVLPGALEDEAFRGAARATFADWRLAAWDVFAAGVAIWYWSLRSRFPVVFRGAQLFEDMRERERQALEIHDNVVQGLAKAKLALDLGQREAGYREVEETLAASQRVISDLLGESGSEVALGPTDLRRERPAGREG